MIEKHPGVAWAFKNFFGIDITEMNEKFKFLKDVISRRHIIIHGDLKDSLIEEKDVESAFNSLKKMVDFLKNKLIRLDREFSKDSFISQ